MSSLLLPRHLLLFVLLTGEAVPFLARLLGVSAYGWEWFTDYLYLLGGDKPLFFGALNLIPIAVLYGLGKASKHRPLAFWFATVAAFGFLVWSHGTINIHGSSTAVLGLIFIPIYGAVVAVVGWMVGAGAHPFLHTEQSRARLASMVAAAALILAAGSVVYETQTVAKRESRFPIVSVKELGLDKRKILACCSQGGVEAIRLGNFDTDPASEIAVLGNSGVTLLDANSYAIKTVYNFNSAQCSHGCLGMYPDVVSDDKGSFFITSSEGVADSRGHLLWALKSETFAQLVPMRLSGDRGPTFFAKRLHDRIERFDTKGKSLWTVMTPASRIGPYIGSDGESFLFAQRGNGPKSQVLSLYSMEGQPKKDIPLPYWATEVQEIAWPTQGHFLIGAGPTLAVLDSKGKEALRHTIQDTSFAPYHGPEGTAVRFNPVTEPYLAVLSHGSSGYPRSVLLIFAPDGRLVWQEEFNKARTLLAVRRANGQGEVLLIGGMDGLVEFRLTH